MSTAPNCALKTNNVKYGELYWKKKCIENLPPIVINKWHLFSSIKELNSEIKLPSFSLKKNLLSHVYQTVFLYNSFIEFKCIFSKSTHYRGSCLYKTLPVCYILENNLEKYIFLLRSLHVYFVTEMIWFFFVLSYTDYFVCE